MDITEFIAAVNKYDFDMTFKVVDDVFHLTIYYNNGDMKKAFTAKEKIRMITGIRSSLFKVFFYSQIENLLKKIMKFSCQNYGILHRCKTCKNKKNKINGDHSQIKECFKEVEIKQYIENFKN